MLRGGFPDLPHSDDLQHSNGAGGSGGRTLRGVGPRIAEHMLDSMHLIPFPAYEHIRLKGY